ncbi:MAG: hypothetical protein ACI8UO_004568 [Verrucomicrobiales bacterium]
MVFAAAPEKEITLAKAKAAMEPQASRFVVQKWSKAKSD